MTWLSHLDRLANHHAIEVGFCIWTLDYGFRKWRKR